MHLEFQKERVQVRNVESITENLSLKSIPGRGNIENFMLLDIQNIVYICCKECSVLGLDIWAVVQRERLFSIVYLVPW